MNRHETQGDLQLDSLLGRVVDRFLHQLANGEQPSVDRYVADYPEIASLIRQAFPVLKVVNDSLTTGDRGGSLNLPGNRQLGDFRLLHELGAGGMGFVYEAEQLSMGRRVAVKILPLAGALQQTQLQRFRNEVRAVAMLDHPNIVSVYSVGEDRGVHYYAMQLIRGQSLADVISELRQLSTGNQSLTGNSIHQVLSSADRSAQTTSAFEPTEEFCSGEDELRDTQSVVKAQISTTPQSGTDREFFNSVARLGIQAADALQHAHESGVLHRDIKPANLMLDADAQLHITDFGLARIDTDVGMTMTGDILGTLRYMSPEQALGKRVVVDQRADIYSLGATLYELLTLQPAFASNDRQDLLRHIAFDEPCRPRKLNRMIPRDLETIILTAMEKNPDERYVSAHAVASDLRAFVERRPIEAHPPTLLQHASKWALRHKPIVASAAVVLLLATIGLGISNVLIARQRTVAIAARSDAEAAEAREAQQRQIAEENFQNAREAVDSFFTEVSENTLFDIPNLHPLRKELLTMALSYYQRFIEDRDDDPGLQAELASAYERAGQITEQIGNRDAAKEHFLAAREIRRRLADLNPNRVDYRADLAQNYFFAGDHKTAVALQREVVDSEASEEHLFWLGRYLNDLGVATRDRELRRKTYQEGIRLMEQLVSEHPDAAGHAHVLAVLRHNLGTATPVSHGSQSFHEQSVREFEALIEKHGPDPRRSRGLATCYSCLAIAALNTGESDVAVRAFERSIEVRQQLVDDYPSVHTFQRNLVRISKRYALFLSDQGDVPERGLAVANEAIKVAKRLAARHPRQDYVRDLASCYAAAAVSHRELGHPKEAVEFFTKSIELRPISWAYFDRSAILLAEGQSNEALVDLEKALQLKPSASWCNNEAWKRAIRPDLELRFQEIVVKLAERAVTLRPEASSYWNTLAMAQYRTGDYESAVKSVRKSMDLSGGEDGFNMLTLVMANWQQGDYQQARKGYAKVVEWMDANEPHDEQLVRLRDEAEELIEAD